MAKVMRGNRRKLKKVDFSKREVKQEVKQEVKKEVKQEVKQEPKKEV